MSKSLRTFFCSSNGEEYSCSRFSRSFMLLFNNVPRIAIFLQGKRNIKPFKQYAKWSEKYQFHVFTTMSLLYGMLKDRVAMETYIKLSGKYSNHWNNPILRRVNAWGTGHFDKFYLALYSTWIFSFLLLTLILSFYYYFHLWDLTIASIQNYDFMINNLV